MEKLSNRLTTLTRDGFPVVAKTLLRKTWIIARNPNNDGRVLCCRIAEVELYLEPDPYTHRDPHQIATSGKWYFHRQAGKGYKGGTFKGVDLTCGPAGVAGGILIRAIIDGRTGDLIEGPCKVVEALLAATGFPDVGSLARAFPGGEDAPDPFAFDAPLRLDENPEAIPLYIAAGPRVGLSAKYPAYRDLPLRLLTEVGRTQKDKGVLLRAIVADVGITRAAHLAGRTVQQMAKYAPADYISDNDPIWAELGL